MTEEQATPAARKRRPKGQLTPSQKYEIWLQMIRQEVTMAEAAAAAGVDHSTIVRIPQVAKDGALAALGASKPGAASKARDAELAAANAEIARLSEAVKELARRPRSAGCVPPWTRTGQDEGRACWRGMGDAILGGMAEPEPTEHASITRFRTELARLGGTGRVVVLADSVHTAALAAEALGCEVGAIANSLLFDADGRPVLILTSGAHRVDTAKVAAQLGVGRLRRAAPDFVREHTGQVIGGVSPIVHPRPIRTCLDPWLDRYPEIWAAAGHPSAVFSTTYEELARLTDAVPLDVE